MSSNLSPVQRINKEDMPGSPAWIDPLISSINLFIQSTNAALDGSLTIPGNIAAQISVVQFTTNKNYNGTDQTTWTPVTFKSSLSVQPRLLLLGQISVVSSQTQYIANNVCISDWTATGGIITINFISGLKASTTYQLTTLSI
jgi:hypothetical protein